MPIKKVKLLWTVHFHQPPGNFGEVFEQYAARVCRPFLSTLQKYPTVKASLHFSGILLSYLKDHQGDLIEKIQDLVTREQVELLGGGFYEPILSMIPREDAELQLRKTIEWIQEEFNTVPRGAWLPESVWEPHFVELLHRAGYAYTLVEDSLFEAMGWKRAQLFRTFRAEYLNRQILLFPSHRLWSRQLPLEGLKEVKAAFTQLSHRPEEQIVTLGQNGDNYGLVPEVHAALYEQGGLEQWFNLLATEQRWIETARLGDVQPPRSPCVTLPSGASESLESCTLSVAAQREYQGARAELAKRYDNDRFIGFFRGGTWLGFLGKYAEAKLMHAKLLWLREQILQLPLGQPRDEALEAILAAEEHSAFWHARNGGVYANYLRDEVYQKLNLAEQNLHSRDRDEAPKVLQTDTDGDGHDEVHLRADLSSILVVPEYGGSLCEYSFWPTHYNLANTFRRRAEAYHDPAALPVTDWYERRMFQDHFVPANTQPAAFQKNSFIEYGDFIDQAYTIVRTTSSRDASTLVLEREGGLYVSGERRPLLCRKVFQMENPGRLTVEYTLTNRSLIPTDVLFVCEVNYTCLSGDAPDRHFHYGDTKARCGDEFNAGKIDQWTIEDGSRNLSWRWRIEGGGGAENPPQIWHHPVHTVTLNQGKPESNYQGSALQIGWPLQLKAGVSTQFKIVCEANKLHD